MNAASTSVEADARLLEVLLAANGEFVPGAALTEALGVSRVAVWGRLERLRAEGIGIEAQRQHGYRLVSEPAELHESLLRAHARCMGVGTDIHFHALVDSTNTEAERLLAAGAETPCVVVANGQTAGRGRMGRQWHSPQSGNLYSSFAFRPELPPRDLSVITLCLGLAVARCLRETFRLSVMLKWPNDLQVGGMKVAGMLTEARVDADRTRDLVFGMGLNIAADTSSWPDEVRQRACTLSTAAGELLPVNRIAMAVIKSVLSGYARFVSGGRDSLMRDWPEFDALIGKRVDAELSGKPVSGVACGIDTQGRLRLRMEDGSERLLHSGEVTISGRRKLG